MILTFVDALVNAVDQFVRVVLHVAPHLLVRVLCSVLKNTGDTKNLTFSQTKDVQYGKRRFLTHFENDST